MNATNSAAEYPAAFEMKVSAWEGDHTSYTWQKNASYQKIVGETPQFYIIEDISHKPGVGMATRRVKKTNVRFEEVAIVEAAPFYALKEEAATFTIIAVPFTTEPSEAAAAAAFDGQHTIGEIMVVDASEMAAMRLRFVGLSYKIREMAAPVATAEPVAETMPVPFASDAQVARNGQMSNTDELTQRCHFCQRPIRPTGLQVHMTTDLELTTAADCDNSQGYFEVGPECAKKIPRRFLFANVAGSELPGFVPVVSAATNAIASERAVGAETRPVPLIGVEDAPEVELVMEQSNAATYEAATVLLSHQPIGRVEGVTTGGGIGLMHQSTAPARFAQP